MIRISLLLLVVLVTFAQPARAFLDPPYITPVHPTAGEAILVNIYGGECDLADSGPVWPPPVTQEGNELTIHLTGSHHTDPEWCYFSIGTETYPVGVYPAGAYVLNVERRYMSASGVWIYETLGIVPFTVTAGTPPFPTVAAPSLNLGGLSVLLLLLASIAACRLRRCPSQKIDTLS